MPNTFTQLYVHIVFAVKYRQGLIRPEWEERLFRFINVFIDRRQSKLIAVNGMPDHIHLLVSLHPGTSTSELVRELKKATTAFIRQQGLTEVPFQWQSGYGAFSCSKAHAEHVRRYIHRQKAHHQQHAFRAEYVGLLRDYEVDFDPAYLFDFLDT
ncbi:MAG: IS200/IS605 family transposase [Lewinella sp.]|nr:IS200/IS605 family transposase [Lewinella sp.]